MLFHRSYKLRIAGPCHESWDQMLPADKGKFCNSCSKVVTDFREMSEKEIAAFLKNNASNTCGRFRHDQVNREYMVPRTVRVPAHKQAIRYLISLFLVGGAASQARGQSRDSVVVQQTDSLREDSLDPLTEKLLPDSLIKSDNTQLAVTDTTLQDSLAVNDSLQVKDYEFPQTVHANIRITNILMEPMGSMVWVQEPPYDPVFPELKIFFADTFSKMCVKLKKLKRKERGEISLAEKTKKPVPKPIPNPARDRRIEGILPAFLTWRGRKQTNNKV